MIKKLAAIFVLFICILLLTCSKNNATEPVNETTIEEELFGEILGSAISDAAVITAVDSAEIDISLDPGTGDSTEVALGNESVYIIAGDSVVSEATALSVECRLLNFALPNDTTYAAMYFDCLPDGLEFDNALVIDVGSECFNNHPNSNAVRLFQYNENSHRWTAIAALPKINPRLQFEIFHFSKYAIAD